MNIVRREKFLDEILTEKFIFTIYFMLCSNMNT